MGKEALKECLVFLVFDKGRLFFIKLFVEKFKIHEIFITADRRAWPILKRTPSSEVFEEFSGKFCTL